MFAQGSSKIRTAQSVGVPVACPMVDAQSVTEIGLIQNDDEDQRSLVSQFGAWVVCTDKPGPFHVIA